MALSKVRATSILQSRRRWWSWFSSFRVEAGGARCVKKPARGGLLGEGVGGLQEPLGDQRGAVEACLWVERCRAACRPRPRLGQGRGHGVCDGVGRPGRRGPAADAGGDLTSTAACCPGRSRQPLDLEGDVGRRDALADLCSARCWQPGTRAVTPAAPVSQPRKSLSMLTASAGSVCRWPGRVPRERLQRRAELRRAGFEEPLASLAPRRPGQGISPAALLGAWRAAVQAAGRRPAELQPAPEVGSVGLFAPAAAPFTGGR